MSHSVRFGLSKAYSCCLLFTMAVLTSALSSVVQADEPLDAPHIIVSAEGKLQAFPDQVRLQIEVAQTAPTLAAAKTVVDELTSQIVTQALAHGVAKDQVDAAQIFASPHQEWQDNKQVYLGERVQRSITLVTQDLQNYSELMQAIVAIPKPAKNREVRIAQVVVEFKDRSALEQQSVQLALKNAKTKASAMAEALSARLGKIYRISDTSAVASPEYATPMRMDVMAMAPQAKQLPNSELQFGKQDIVQSVQVIFLLEQ